MSDAAKLDAILSLVGDLKADVSGLKSDVSGLKADVSSLASRVDGLSARVEGVDARMEQTRAELLKTRAEIMARIDRVQDALTEQRDDLSVMLGLIDGAQRIAERGLSEARTNFDQQNRAISITTTLERQIRRLQDEVRQLRGEAP